MQTSVASCVGSGWSALLTSAAWYYIDAVVTSGYSTREAAGIAGLTESIVRSCARSGLLSQQACELPPILSFQDLAVLKSVRELTREGLSFQRVRKELASLRSAMPETGLSRLNLGTFGGHVIVRDGQTSWQAVSGQLLLGFEQPPAPVGEMRDLPLRHEAEPPEPAFALSADQWLERAAEIEEADPNAAMEAYKRALHLRPDCSETLINLGRLHAESGMVAEAADCFTRAIELDPRDATAVYNLGVVAQDMERDDDAIELYQRALVLDPNLAEAHYNLATIYDRSGDPHAAIRHIHEYRKLTRGHS